MKKYRPCLCGEAEKTKKSVKKLAVDVNSMLGMSDKEFRNRAALTMVDKRDLSFYHDMTGTKKTKLKLMEGDDVY